MDLARTIALCFKIPQIPIIMIPLLYPSTVLCHGAGTPSLLHELSYFDSCSVLHLSECRLVLVRPHNPRWIYRLTLIPSLDIFYGLNVVRMLSIVALLLAFSSSIVVVVSDIRAVNKFQHVPSSNNKSCGYIECVHPRLCYVQYDPTLT